VDDDKRMMLTRAANHLVGLTQKGAYTSWELQEAGAQYAARMKTQERCTAEYGVPGSSLRKVRVKIEAAVGPNPSLLEARRAACTLEKDRPGP
jgi:hypothetical protein